MDKVSERRLLGQVTKEENGDGFRNALQQQKKAQFCI